MNTYTFQLLDFEDMFDPTNLTVSVQKPSDNEAIAYIERLCSDSGLVLNHELMLRNNEFVQMQPQVQGPVDPALVVIEYIELNSEDL